jgi:hypothetical protein
MQYEMWRLKIREYIRNFWTYSTGMKLMLLTAAFCILMVVLILDTILLTVVGYIIYWTFPWLPW